MHPWEKGISFYIDRKIYSLKDVSFRACPGFSFLEVNSVKVFTLEHLFAALNGLEIDNVLIEIKGNEIPALDGSSLEFVKGIKDVGFYTLNKERKYYSLSEPLEIKDNGSFVKLEPFDHLEINYSLIPKRPLPKNINTTKYTYIHSQENFENKIAPCRTFCFKEDIEKIKSMGLGKGGNLENTLIIDIDKTLNSPRFSYEPIGHKILDLLGDLYTLGYFLRAKIIAQNTYHILNIKLANILKEKIKVKENV